MSPQGAGQKLSRGAVCLPREVVQEVGAQPLAGQGLTMARGLGGSRDPASLASSFFPSPGLLLPTLTQDLELLGWGWGVAAVPERAPGPSPGCLLTLTTRPPLPPPAVPAPKAAPTSLGWDGTRDSFKNISFAK